MVPDRTVMLELLRENGFATPEQWLEYAISHHFTQVNGHRLSACPDCAEQKTSHVGQFVYYSNLVRLQTCSGCGLIFSDTRIDPQVIQGHFEQAYKDEDYFRFQRQRVFRQLVDEIDVIAPKGGAVLDIGGAKGHLMALLKERRSDLRPVVNDLSEGACVHAAAAFGLETIVGGVQTLEQQKERFQVIVMSDVAYYEPELKRLWGLLPRLLAPNGAVILRIPNKLPLIRIWQGLLTLGGGRRLRLQSRIRFFNPEHLYVFSRRYLTQRLEQMGFGKVRFIPSELLMQGREGEGHSLFYRCAQTLHRVTRGEVILTPSLLVVAEGCDCLRQGDAE